MLISGSHFGGRESSVHDSPVFSSSVDDQAKNDSRGDNSVCPDGVLQRKRLHELLQENEMNEKKETKIVKE